MFDAAMADDPYPTYAALREGSDVAYARENRVWIIHRHADVRRLLRDPAGFSSEMPAFEKTLLHADGERHRRARKALALSFSPAATRSREQAIQRTVDEALDRLEERVRGDVVADLAVPVPQTITGQMLGLAEPELAMLPRWADGITDRGEHRLAPLKEARIFLREHLSGFTAREGAPEVAALDAASGLSLGERVDLGVLLIAASVATTTSLIGSAVQMLMADPGLTESLRREPGLAPQFIEEVLRFRAPIQRVRRIATYDTEVAGQPIPAGAAVVGLIGAANRDPRVFSDADEFQPFRQTKDHIAFGAGPHICIGLSLARVEATLAIQALVRRFSRIVSGPVVEMKHGLPGVFGPARLDIEVRV